jgi:RNA polymerase sigma factor (TIGR02999 family)
MEMLHESPNTDADNEGFASDELLPIIYNELRNLAAYRLNNELGYQTLQPTALVHEAWVRIAGSEHTAWKSRAHFFGAAAVAMRRILVERARSKTTVKRKAPMDAATLEHGWMENDDHIIMIHECLILLEKTDPDSAKVVLLKFYGGLSSKEIGEITGRSLRSVERQWMFAKAKLYQIILAQQESRNRDGS